MRSKIEWLKETESDKTSVEIACVSIDVFKKNW